MDLTTLFNQARSHYKSGRPFVLFKKPNTEHIQGYFQLSETNHVVTQDVNEGFLFADFSGKRQRIILKNDADYFSVSMEESNVSWTSKSLATRSSAKEKQTHLDLVRNGVCHIESDLSEKIVLSRCEQFELPYFSIETSFRFICYNYKNAMCYVWFHPETGLWLGATPEILLSIDRNELRTMSLAGTQLFSNQEVVHWSHKERKEQQYVTDYIAQILKEELEEVSVSEPYTIQAGSLLHLRTDLKATLKRNTDVFGLVQRLHPTPAVCGVPKEEALNFILTKEGYDREFYTGYLGELNGYANCELYVNLRCVKIDGSKASVYVGGGITRDSNPEDEWFETEEKSKVIKKALAFG